MDFVKVTDEVLHVGEIAQLVSHRSTGAISMFVGTTRENFEGKEVIRLEYEAYRPMAVKTLNKLCQTVRTKWLGQLHNVAIYHRLGNVLPGEASVVIAVTSKHRKEAIDAVQFTINELKATVPIWKKEWYSDGSTWKQNAECSWSSRNVDSGNEKDSEITIDPSLVQIVASEDEVERRMEAFMARKKEENNVSNILEFCGRHVNDDPYEYSCARTDSVVVRKKGSKSHLRRTKVDNGAFQDSPSVNGQVSDMKLPDSIAERVENLEDHLAFRPVSKDIYRMIKEMEDRVLYLESLSPEYFSCGTADDASDSKWTERGSMSVSKNEPGVDARFKQEYRENLDRSLTSVNRRIQELQSKFRKHSEPIERHS